MVRSSILENSGCGLFSYISSANVASFRGIMMGSPQATASLSGARFGSTTMIPDAFSWMIWEIDFTNRLIGGET